MISKIFVSQTLKVAATRVPLTFSLIYCFDQMRTNCLSRHKQIHGEQFKQENVPERQGHFRLSQDKPPCNVQHTALRIIGMLPMPNDETSRMESYGTCKGTEMNLLNTHPVSSANQSNCICACSVKAIGKKEGNFFC